MGIVGAFAGRQNTPYFISKEKRGNHPPAMAIYVRFPLSFRNGDNFLHERGIIISYGTVRFLEEPTGSDVRRRDLYQARRLPSVTAPTQSAGFIRLLLEQIGVQEGWRVLAYMIRNLCQHM